MIKRVIISSCYITILSALLCACQFNTDNNTNVEEVTMVMSNIPNNGIETEPGSRQLELEDFSVHSKKNTIELGSLFEKFIEIDMEKEEGNDYVGEIYKDNQLYYNVYIHYYSDFDLYTSNLNYDVENRDFDTYIIQQITLKTPVYKTNRDIAIGSSLKDVVNVYSEGTESLENQNRTLVYSLGNKSIRFIFDKHDTVNSIVVSLEKSGSFLVRCCAKAFGRFSKK